ncbi:thioredoxin [Nonlabens spongiae]|uniref:Thioredoxin n=1 Tax=Nonlabens spongiae TaxID=331648 RepID=A0A1W6MNP4_9FLAO|nr:TlpA disulfide reductase family protein [Nonlabens spongiae]ARN79230.1 thioredoxin [Nonlabens spongiae]
MKKMFFLFLILSLISCEKQLTIAQAQKIDRDEFKKVLKKESEKVQVINFWATWCAPCVEELPAFEEMSKKYDDELDMTLISLDDADLIDKKVNPFLRENEITATVLLLDDPYSSEWIPMVDPHWDGAIPVTLIKNNSKSRFYNRTFTENELEKEIQSFL